MLSIVMRLTYIRSANCCVWEDTSLKHQSKNNLQITLTYRNFQISAFWLTLSAHRNNLYCARWGVILYSLTRIPPTWRRGFMLSSATVTAPHIFKFTMPWHTHTHHSLATGRLLDSHAKTSLTGIRLISTGRIIDDKNTGHVCANGRKVFCVAEHLKLTMLQCTKKQTKMQTAIAQ